PSSIDDPTNIQAVPFTLSQNYPNPFNPTTTISFDVRDEKAIYNLSIYDLKGRKVISLKQGMLSRGSHNVAWNGRDANNLEVASGVYFYRLDNGKDSISKKMILMK
ncbi:MAG: T9SS type A sorting domain-containing protein, partial [Candidatus Cloacimonetes bacterium]|nr:T9SS type A sorting domain-containing protein [Candidatus Cloacimonadota bacterium]